MTPSSIDPIEQRISALMGRMTLAEMVGQMIQVDASSPSACAEHGEDLRAGRIGALINQVDVVIVNELQRIAVEESRLGIPLLVGRDVIHGFSTVGPIPLGQAATWNPDLVKAGARAAAAEAAAAGINWTFAPMIDVARDPRWGRIAESFGEDPLLTSRLGVAMIQGFQGNDLAAADSIAACAKHFAGYGAAESGRDYATTNIPETELRNVYLPPFRSAVDAKVATVMASFSDLNGIPASANTFLMTDVLRAEWGFDGFVVSDWDSIRQLAVHGLTGGDRDSALAAASAGVDMEMAGTAYRDHLVRLVEDGEIGREAVESAVRRILRIKFRLGLFENPFVEKSGITSKQQHFALEIARKAALQSVVLLKNDGQILPLDPGRLGSVAVVGPLADAPYEQLGTWIFDGDPTISVSGLRGIRNLVGNDVEIRYVRAMATTRSRDTAEFRHAVEAARNSDAVILFLGEESILSGEAHSRADIGLPGAQVRLVKAICEAGKPVIGVILAGRPLTLAEIADDMDALLFAWHPGTLGGAAIADLLFGMASPSGKLPVTFPKMVGQVPIYYSQKNTGKPPTPESVVFIDDIEPQAPQTSFGMTAFHLDAGYEPLFPFGHGLSYTSFRYHNLELSSRGPAFGESLTVRVCVTNDGDRASDEVVQLYVRDPVASMTRPVRELKDFSRVRVEAGQTVPVCFELHTGDLAFFGRDNRLVTEPGDFHVWVGGSSKANLGTTFRLLPPA